MKRLGWGLHGAAIVLGVMLAASTLGLGTEDDPIRLVGWSIDAGGGEASSGSWSVRSVIGQPDAGTSAGPTFTVAGGVIPSPLGGAVMPPCPTDLDGDGSTGFDDVLAVLAAWGTCEACPEDIDGGGAVDFADLLALLADWGPCS